MSGQNGTVNDLVNASQTANPSATMTPGQNANPLGDFVSMLSKYAMGGVNAAGKYIGNQPLIPQPIVSSIANKGKVIGPTISNAADYLSGGKNNPIGLPGIDLLHGQATPMSILGLASLGMGGAENPEDAETAAEKDIPVEKPPMITANKADPMSIAKMQLNFDVPRRIAQNQSVKPETVMNQLIDDNISGRSLDDLQTIADSITGEHGAFPKINNYILSKIDTPIDYSAALKAKDENLPAVLDGEKKGFITQVNQEVNKALEPLNYNKPGELPSALPAGQGYATDLFQASQNLREIARMYQRKAYTDMGELNHPEMERAAQAITEIKNNIDDAIDQQVPPQTYEQFKNDPYVQQQLQRVPPKVAQRYMQGASRFKDGQAIQAPYVNLSNMIEDTKDTQLSVWTKAAKAMQQQNTSGQAANVVKENIPGPKIVKNVAGGIVGKVVKPFDKKPEDIFEENMQAKSNPSANMKVKIPTTAKIIGGLGLAGLTGAGLESLSHPSNASTSAQSQNHTDNSNNSHAINGSTIETDMSKIDPNSQAIDPRTVTGADGTSLAMDEGKYQTAMAALDSLTKSDPSYITNPIKAGQLAAAKDAIEKKHAASQQLMQSYQKVQNVSQKVADARKLLSQTSPVLTDKMGFLEGAHEVFDPKYQSLVNDLKFIENSDPRLKGQLSDLGTKQSVQTALDNAAKLLLSEHNQLLKSYGAGDSSLSKPTKTTQQQTTTPSQIPAALPAPVNGSLPKIQSGSYQFTVPNPLFQ